MEFSDLVKQLEEKFPGQLKTKVQYGCNYIYADVDNFKDVIKSLKMDFDFKYIVDIVATHWPKKEDKFELTYNLFSIPNKLRVFVMVSVKEPVIPTITDIYKGANFMEREEYDLMGITFEGHPDLRRILLPEFFKGHPLRKDYNLKDREWFNAVDEQGVGINFSK